MISMIILGGLADNKGAIVGVIIMILLPEVLRFVGFPTEIAAQMRQVIYGLMLVLMMLYRPQGIFGKFKI
jgi:branched-chain amino acid transport system permease protein